jgi:virulence-associated protein VagC
VTIPLEHRFPEVMTEVYIRKEGSDVIRPPRPKDWARIPYHLDTDTCSFPLRHTSDALLERTDWRKQGQFIGANDLLIAAHAGHYERLAHPASDRAHEDALLLRLIRGSFPGSLGDLTGSASLQLDRRRRLAG